MNTLYSFEFISIILILVCLGVIVFLLNKLNKIKKRKDELEKVTKELEMKVHPLELERISYKLNPHLFKNALNSIQSHAYQAYYSLDKLANVLDYVLYESEQQMVSLKEEVEFALNLIEINRLKVSPLFDLRIKNKIGEDNALYKEKLIAPLISIDLIENAFKHSDLQSADAFISIVFDLVDQHFVLSVSNKVSSVPTIKKGKGGFGQENFKKRLEIIYKNNHQYEHYINDGVYIAQLKINLLGYQNKMLAS